MTLGREMKEREKKDIVSELKSLGLSTYEALTFHALATHSEMTASALCGETGIPDSKIYHTLTALEGKGVIAVTKTRPSQYRALSPEEAMSNLRMRLEEEHRQRMERLEKMTSKLSVIYEAAGNGEEVELAYIVQGLSAILARARGLIKNAKRSLMLFVPDDEVWGEIKEAVREAAKRGVRVEVGLTDDVTDIPLIKDLSLEMTIKRLNCYCWIIVADGRTMMNARDWRWDKAVALLTQEPTMIRFASEFFSNPTCCSEITRNNTKVQP